jgi:DNA adenine methylase
MPISGEIRRIADKGSVRPLLKWAGGKRQLLPMLRAHYPASFDRYIEPFFGSGAVFFDLYAAGRLKGRRARLVDLNQDLIACYRVVRDETEAVIAALETLQNEHRAHGHTCYYRVRNDRFNPARAALADQAQFVYSPELAAMLIYLNRTGFNGLYRVNRQGEFNVPVGRYAHPRICDPAHIRAVARALSADGVTLDCQPFEEALREARAGDFVYCDPPYAPLSRTASFAHYTAAGFTGGDHERLQESVVCAARRGAVILLSSSSAPEIESSYRTQAAQTAGLAVRRVPARRAINCLATRRGCVEELLITNVPVGTLTDVKPQMLSMRKTKRAAEKPSVS